MRRREIRKRVGEIAEMLRLTHTLARKPGTLSGGEQQRCAIGRALIRRPQPAAARRAADQPRRQAAPRHARRVQAAAPRARQHDNRLRDARPARGAQHGQPGRACCGRGGSCRSATPQALYGAPDDEFVASLVGDPPINLVAGKVAAGGPHRAAVHRVRRLGLARRSGGMPVGTDLRVGLRPQGVFPAARQGGAGQLRGARAT